MPPDGEKNLLSLELQFLFPFIPKKNPDFHQDCILFLFVSLIFQITIAQSLLPIKEEISVAKIKTVIS